MHGCHHPDLNNSSPPLNCSGSVTGILNSFFFGGIVVKLNGNHQVAAVVKTVR